MVPYARLAMDAVADQISAAGVVAGSRSWFEPAWEAPHASRRLPTGVGASSAAFRPLYRKAHARGGVAAGLRLRAAQGGARTGRANYGQLPPPAQTQQ